jgi:hypothetical protein
VVSRLAHKSISNSEIDLFTCKNLDLIKNSGAKIIAVIIDCERSLLSAGLDFRACERKGGTADNTSRNDISNYAINNFQSEC